MSKYQYYFRPCYHSQELLIDVFNGAENETFIADFLDSIADIKPKMSDILDLWMNDEIILTVDSEAGHFLISKDIWGFGFITAEHNQEGLSKINAILENSELFEKIEVDFENYK